MREILALNVEGKLQLYDAIDRENLRLVCDNCGAEWNDR